MTVPNTLLDLGLTLRAEHDSERSRHTARLAARLGFRYLWLPLPENAPVPDVAALAESARPARLGLVVGGDPQSLVQRVAALCGGELPGDLLLEIHAPAELRDRLVAAVGGADQWRRRAFVPWYDETAAGHVVLAEQAAGREEALKGLADASERGGGRDGAPVLSIALTVSIGRTMSEAEARAQRDPALSGPHHPKIAGLFGTLEHAQEQGLELARAGAGALRATLADEQDVADLLAQLRAVAVGPTPLLHARTR
ncbi:hypothetical protein SSP24_09170 [Streptomyces spinoverrucosus]|uniref:Luciferase-like domain-containing protein n=1 Tax=Streptomyces spinoverrucosus TaxID=284043 RepID=A0A4Y3V7U3_9ACTN|nr:hypothetical protein [Streptomyces spinoverrucosus]GEC03262.1 hypothetical protein SSP24_09170 [Streptomyces spinoverrucosus]GHB37026.1 hypothetical protein GCM10010397_03390 [Streptomyces spinoverrucosus]